MRNILSATCLMLLCLVAEVGLSQRDTSSLFVDGVCGMCEDRIETAASKVKGVIQADWDVDSRILNLITKSNYKESKLHKAVNAVGHDTESVKASDEAYNKLHACCKYRDPDQIATHHKDHDDHENHREDDGIKFFVDGICGMCEDRIETAVQKVEGVEKADWNVDNRMLSVAFAGKKIEEIILHQAVAAAGHDTRKVKASEEAYDKLHDCCKYRDAYVVAEHKPKEIFEKAPASLSGNILVEENGKAVPLPGVNIYWLDAKPAAVTDTEGKFNLKRPEGANQVVVSYVGYYSDTIALTQETAIKVTLTPGTTLETVEVVYQRKAIEVSFVEPILIQQIGRKELLKAACCNLAESFETNPAVDVSFTDAVTGARQIEMLGLAGPYTQITRENLPDVRGLASIYGLVYIPGPWVKGIQLAKGPGSVINGFESMTGQINVELKKPEEGERAYFNLYANQGNNLTRALYV